MKEQLPSGLPEVTKKQLDDMDRWINPERLPLTEMRASNTLNRIIFIGLGIGGMGLLSALYQIGEDLLK